MPLEYKSTLVALKRMKQIADEDVNLTDDRVMEFEERIKGHLTDLIEEIEAEGVDETK